VAAEILGADRALGGGVRADLAKEVAAGMPTAVTVAARDLNTADAIAQWLRSDRVRVYTSTDMPGVELGGAIKNVLAIATGISDGLGFGANARAALITRGLAEMRRLIEAVGGKPETVMGLAGIGDLVLTCTDNQSRNRRVGLALGKGRKLQATLAEIGQVAEGVVTARECRRWPGASVSRCRSPSRCAGCCSKRFLHRSRAGVAAARGAVGVEAQPLAVSG